MALRSAELFGVREDLAASLKTAGLTDSDKLLAAAATPADRKALAAKLGVDEREVLELANRADLARIKGIAGVYSDLLEEAGVDTVKELRGRVPENLHAKLLEINAAKNLTAQPPSLKMVATWVWLARKRRKFLQY